MSYVKIIHIKYEPRGTESGPSRNRVVFWRTDQNRLYKYCDPRLDRTGSKPILAGSGLPVTMSKLEPGPAKRTPSRP